MNGFLEKIFDASTLSKAPFFVIAGPCVVEGEQLCMDIAGTVQEVTRKLGLPYVFKASYRKANRTSINSFTGLGDENGLAIVQKVGKYYKLPTTSDIHSAEEATLAAPFIDILQIPAFLCRQTDILLSAAETGKIVNVKKGQFLSGASMQFAVEKIRNAGNENIILTERGNTFGYQDLVVDYRNIPIMRSFNVPVVMDCTHSLQQPNQTSGVTGGNPQFIELMAKCALAAGANGLFIETHPSPKDAKSDGANMLPLTLLKDMLERLVDQFGKN
jgi:2-dehydro-3-deoxyphosphooctonate aldolase (KDO 8-P synthase)